MVSMTSAMRFGVARGVFSNEAGMGSAAITAAAATTDNPVRQGYINMTGTFWDTIVVCTITGTCDSIIRVLGMTNAAGEMLTGSDITIAAFETILSFRRWMAGNNRHYFILRFPRFLDGSIMERKHLSIFLEHTNTT